MSLAIPFPMSKLAFAIRKALISSYASKQRQKRFAVQHYYEHLARIDPEKRRKLLEGSF